MGQISRMNLRNLEARRFQAVESRPAQVRIDNNLAVTSLEAKGDDTANVEFTYTASYGAMGVIKIDGDFLLADPNIKAAVAEWGQKRQMPPEIASQVHTTIMQACLPEAVLLAKTIHLPPPIPMPQIRFQGQKAQASQKVDMDPAVG